MLTAPTHVPLSWGPHLYDHWSPFQEIPVVKGLLMFISINLCWIKTELNWTHFMHWSLHWSIQTPPWSIQTLPGPYRNSLVHTETPWSIQTSLGLYRHPLVHKDLAHTVHPLVHTDTPGPYRLGPYRHPLVLTDLVHTDILWSIQTWSIKVHSLVLTDMVHIGTFPGPYRHGP